LGSWHGITARRLLCFQADHDNGRHGPKTREEEMDDQAFQNKFNELISKINELPQAQRANLEQLAQDTKDRRERIQTSVSELQESLDYLRLSVKYLVFDLEATRRENAYLRKLLEQTNADSSEQQDYEDDSFHDHEG
jgi:chromosome segregation ATPase